ncbi:hypothetical protein [Pseudobutyrivibrio sp.]|uniref:hypothetical protein n=1 Tax=Pseudobutyrivibrio sp. TaxID=2014367 RepID=UPI001D385BA0|nr:hypothetical protein [Pseudobutyrivibrio sp.]MBE5912023.1 hypothetical protein [Pseudobutyrivibrio sp.]
MGSKFHFSTDQIQNSKDEFNAICLRLKENARQIDSIAATMESSADDNADLYSALTSISGKVYDEALKCETLQQAIERVIGIYLSCEEGILSKFRDIAGGDAIEAYSKIDTGIDKRSTIEKIIDFILFKKVNKDYVATSSAKEAASDKKMMEQIKRINKKSAYSEEKWVAADYAQRKEMLVSYMNEVAGVLGLNIYSSITFFNEKEDGEGRISVGRYDERLKRIKINEYYLKNYPAEYTFGLYTTVVHELRHAYQHAAISNPTKYCVSQETINKWKHSFDIYEEEMEKGYENYRNLEVEKDARMFAGQD